MKRFRSLLFLLPIVVLLLFVTWFARPLSVAEMFPQLSWDGLDSVSGWYYQDLHVHNTDKLPAADPAVARLVSQLRDARFCRSLPGTLAVNLPLSRWKEVPDSSCHMETYFYTDTGYLILKLYIDELTFRYVSYGRGPGLEYRCSTDGHQALIDGALSLLRANTS